MPRPPRVFVEGGIYHVYNRVTRGERVFEEKQEAALLLEAMREIRDRDGLIVLAWKYRIQGTLPIFSGIVLSNPGLRGRVAPPFGALPQEAAKTESGGRRLLRQ